MTNKIAKNLERFKIAINSHDRINPSHSPAYGIGVSAFDLERLGFDDGEELWPGIRIEIDSGTSGNFRVLCNGSHNKNEINQEEDIMIAVGIFV